MKKNLSYGQRVRVVKTNSTSDGIEGAITGIASINWFDVYIVSLDSAIETNAEIMPKFSTLAIPEQNLEIIS